MSRREKTKKTVLQRLDYTNHIWAFRRKYAWFGEHKLLLATVACVCTVTVALVVGYWLNQLGFNFTPLVF